MGRRTSDSASAVSFETYAPGPPRDAGRAGEAPVPPGEATPEGPAAPPAGPLSPAVPSPGVRLAFAAAVAFVTALLYSIPFVTDDPSVVRVTAWAGVSVAVAAAAAAILWSGCGAAVAALLSARVSPDLLVCAGLLLHTAAVAGRWSAFGDGSAAEGGGAAAPWPSLALAAACVAASGYARHAAKALLEGFTGSGLETALGPVERIGQGGEPDGRIDPAAAAPGHVLLLGEGEGVPADGTVIDGAAEVYERRFGGGGASRVVGPGVPVWAGSTVVRGRIVYRVDESLVDSDYTAHAAGADLLLSKGTRGDAARLVTEQRLLLVVAALALGAGAYRWRSSGDLASAAVAAAAVLMTAVLPAFSAVAVTARRVGLTRLFREGVTVRRAGAWEAIGAVRSVLADASGLAAGPVPVRFEVSDPDVDPAVAAGVVRALLGSSDHPVLRAADRCVAAALPAHALVDVRVTPRRPDPADVVAHGTGRAPVPGVAGRVGRTEVFLGTEEFLIDAGVTIGVHDVEDDVGGAVVLYCAAGGAVFAKVVTAPGDPAAPASALRRIGRRLVLWSSEADKAAAGAPPGRPRRPSTRGRDAPSLRGPWPGRPGSTPSCATPAGTTS